MKIQLILESEEECLALERYMRYCLGELNISISYYNYSSFQKNLVFVIKENPDLMIINSHFESMEYPLPHLHDLGFEIVRSPHKIQKAILVLYEKLNNELPEEWKCFLRIPWSRVNLSDRIKELMDKKVFPTDEQIKELNRLYPPIKLDHHHHRRYYRQGVD